MSKKTILLCLLVTAFLGAGPALGQQGEWQGGIRLTVIAPDERSGTFADTGTGLSIDSVVSAELRATHWIYDDWALELGVTGAEHSLTTAGGSDPGLDGGRVWMAPVTFTLQYHPPLTGRLSPYVGAGLAYLAFPDYTVSSSLADLGVRTIDFENGVGFAAQVGLSFEVSNTWSANVDVKFLWVSSEAEMSLVNGEVFDTISLAVDPWVIGVGIGYWF